MSLFADEGDDRARRAPPVNQLMCQDCVRKRCPHEHYHRYVATPTTLLDRTPICSIGFASAAPEWSDRELLESAARP